MKCSVEISAALVYMNIDFGYAALHGLSQPCFFIEISAALVYVNRQTQFKQDASISRDLYE
jgi:hypothetical protein